MCSTLPTKDVLDTLFSISQPQNSENISVVIFISVLRKTTPSWGLSIFPDFKRAVCPERISRMRNQVSKTSIKMVSSNLSEKHTVGDTFFFFLHNWADIPLKTFQQFVIEVVWEETNLPLLGIFQAWKRIWPVLAENPAAVVAISALPTSAYT